MSGEGTKVQEGRAVGPKSGWEFSLHLQRPRLVAHTYSELGHAVLQLVLLFYHLVLAPSTFRVAMAIFKSCAEDLVLLPHPALSCNKAWEAPSGPAIGYGWRAATISEGKHNQTGDWGMNYTSYHSPRWQQQLFTDQQHQKLLPSNLTRVELLEKFFFSKHTSRNSYTLLIPLAFTK